MTEATAAQLQGVLSQHPGDAPVSLRLTKPSGTTVMRLGNGLLVSRSDPLYADLKAALGANCVA
jgi:hypothetical protein